MVTYSLKIGPTDYISGDTLRQTIIGGLERYLGDQLDLRREKGNTQIYTSPHNIVRLNEIEGGVVQVRVRTNKRYTEDYLQLMVEMYTVLESHKRFLEQDPRNIWHQGDPPPLCGYSHEELEQQVPAAGEGKLPSESGLSDRVNS
ncbi:MAG: hypothetical protein KKC75_06315 [Nanoarchaeota archaeon]|nr:hypothetical protein [Nanoarchaeota archaeon]MBU1946129.1 hypothetical protein [Nanoarchaeota archaeon]